MHVQLLEIHFWVSLPNCRNTGQLDENQSYCRVVVVSVVVPADIAEILMSSIYSDTFSQCVSMKLGDDSGAVCYLNGNMHTHCLCSKSLQ